jgi:rubrerythrin
MKKIIFLFAVTIICLTGKSQTPYYYYYEGEKKYLSLNTGYAFISLTEQHLSTDILKRHNVTAKELYSDRTDNKQYQGKKRENRFYTELHFNEKLSEAQYLELLTDIKRNLYNKKNNYICRK